MSPIPPFGTQAQAQALSGVTFPANDRTWLAEQKAAQHQEQRAEDELQHYQLMGAGLAAFCISFWETIREAEPVSDVRFTHDEALRLLEAALRGR